ncbi:hypothetical protein DQ04_06341020 [Trypanosoma grayi]|uniref:hypothetical protein n=1 Tax=Trypanosoma grayi TaxID=71804 RepID=UPI0004F4801E|nr:hypothetical protein DQ04_06341020 [Trypanosoma grayi]KEG08837.1 hypothetical protein DQ04_06341020 [Trypanosoma grayi]
MPKVRNTSLIIVGAVGFIAVAAGRAAWDLAVLFNLIHAVALLAVFAALKSLDPDGRAAKFLSHAFYLLLAGTALFAGSIYALCLGAPSKTVGPLTPIGGITLMTGWITAALAGF